MPHPFAVGDAAAIEKLFADQIRALSPRFNNPVWRGRAVALIGCVAPALVWLRDHNGVRLDFEVVRFATDLRWITKAALEGIVLLRDPASGDVTEMDVRGELPRSRRLASAMLHLRNTRLRPRHSPGSAGAPSAGAAQLRVAVLPARLRPAPRLRHSHGRRPPDAKSGCRSRSLLS